MRINKGIYRDKAVQSEQLSGVSFYDIGTVFFTRWGGYYVEKLDADEITQDGIQFEIWEDENDPDDVAFATRVDVQLLINAFTYDLKAIRSLEELEDLEDRYRRMTFNSDRTGRISKQQAEQERTQVLAAIRNRIFELKQIESTIGKLAYVSGRKALSFIKYL